MAYYLVDYENVKADGMYGVDQARRIVCVFSTVKTHPHLPSVFTKN